MVSRLNAYFCLNKTMIRLNSRDIIQRAQQIADLENSSFTSWNENMQLLNEAYRKLYQMCIDSNDKFFLKTITLNDLHCIEHDQNKSIYLLPDDFYSLQSIQEPTLGTTLLRKAATEPNSSQRYELINNHLYIYGMNNVNYSVNYYPVPDTLTIKADDKNIRCPDGKILDVNGNKALIQVEADDTFTMMIYDWSNGKKKIIGESSTSYDWGILGKKAAYAHFDDGFTMFDIVSGTIIETESTIVGKKDGCVYRLDEDEDNTYSLYKENNFLLANEITLDSTKNYFTFNDTLSDFYFADEDGIYDVTEISTDKIADTTDFSKTQYADGELYSVNEDICINGQVLISGEDIFEYYGISKIDDSTGYGLVVKNIDEDTLIKSCFVDTELSFPNNLYFSYAAYMLAIAYKTKQNADTSALMAAANEERAAFNLSQSRDVSCVSRIQNVCNYGWW